MTTSQDYPERVYTVRASEEFAAQSEAAYNRLERTDYDAAEDWRAGLCDSTTDRFIQGQSFGKLWKHQLRTARANLAQHGLIAYDPQQRVWHRL